MRATIFDKYNASICRDLHREKQARCFDGTEVHRVIDRALPGLENAAAAATIKAAVEVQYRNTTTLEDAIDQRFDAENSD